MSPITKELVLIDDESHIIWHTSTPETLVGPIVDCLRRLYQTDYPHLYFEDCVQTHRLGATIDTINPRVRIKEFKIFINEGFDTPRYAKIDITVDHNTHVEHFQTYVNAIRRTISQI